MENNTIDEHQAVIESSIRALVANYLKWVRVYLRTIYLAEIENFLLKVL